nr:hypothetical protein Ade03nite_17080 [Actinoplanes derwentensis]
MLWCPDPTTCRYGMCNNASRCQGILFVLHTGIGWEDPPQELGFGSGMTCRHQGPGQAALHRGTLRDAEGGEPDAVDSREISTG